MKNFSIVIPIYKIELENNFDYFIQLINSISRNCINVNIKKKLNEIVIVNDQVEKELKDIIENIFEKENLLKKLKYIQNAQNYGQAKSRNIGFLHTTGEYIHFIDQDDFIDENFYTNLIDQSEAILVGSPHLFLNSKQLEINYINNRYIRKLSNTKKISDLWLLLISNFAVSPGQYLISRKEFLRISGFPVLTNKGSDDYCLLFKLASIEASIKYCDKAVFFYRLHEMQNRNSSNLKKSVIEFFKQPNAIRLTRKLLFVKFIRKNIVLWRITSKIIYSFYFHKVKTK